MTSQRSLARRYALLTRRSSSLISMVGAAEVNTNPPTGSLARFCDNINHRSLIWYFKHMFKTEGKIEGKVEAVTILLLLAMMFYTVALFVAEYRFQSDAVFFQVISNILSGIVGAFLMRTKPASSSASTIDHPQSVSTTTVTQETVKAPTP